MNKYEEKMIFWETYKATRTMGTLLFLQIPTAHVKCAVGTRMDCAPLLNIQMEIICICGRGSPAPWASAMVM